MIVHGLVRPGDWSGCELTRFAILTILLSTLNKVLRSWALRGPNGSAAIRRSRRLRAPQILAERSLQFSVLARGAFSRFSAQFRVVATCMEPLVEYGTTLVIGTSPCRQKGEGTEGIYAADAPR